MEDGERGKLFDNLEERENLILDEQIEVEFGHGVTAWHKIFKVFAIFVFSFFFEFLSPFSLNFSLSTSVAASISANSEAELLQKAKKKFPKVS